MVCEALCAVLICGLFRLADHVSRVLLKRFVLIPISIQMSIPEKR